MTFCALIYSSVLGLDVNSPHAVRIVWFGTDLTGSLGSSGLSLKASFSVCRELVGFQAAGSRCEVSCHLMSGVGSGC